MGIIEGIATSPICQLGDERSICEDLANGRHSMTCVLLHIQVLATLNVPLTSFEPEIQNPT